MATQPKATAPDVVGHIILLRPDQIDASDRLRPLDMLWVEALAGVLQAEGQRTPIEVCRLPGRSEYTLVTGAHRHAAAALKGIYLRAEVVTNDATERRLREVSENIHRRDLAPLDRATFLAELVATHKVRAGLSAEEDGRSVSANARWQKTLQNEADDTSATIALVYGWADETAASLGLSRRTVYNDLLLYRRISPSIIASLRRADHPVLRNAAQLRALAKLDENAQRHVLGLLLHANMNIPGAPFAKVTDAIKARDGKAKGAAVAHDQAEQKRLNAFTGAFDRMSVREKKGALEQLAAKLPAGWTLREGASPDNAEQLQAALDLSFGIIARLCTGDGVDDDELEAVRKVAQRALFASRGCDLGDPS